MGTYLIFITRLRIKFPVFLYFVDVDMYNNIMANCRAAIIIHLLSLKISTNGYIIFQRELITLSYPTDTVKEHIGPYLTISRKCIKFSIN